MSDFYGHAEAIAQVESELTATATLSQTHVGGGSVFPCIVGDRAESKTLGYGGFATGADITVVIRKALFAGSTYPSPQDTVTLTDRTVGVETVTHAPDGSVVVLACNDLTKGV